MDFAKIIFIGFFSLLFLFSEANELLDHNLGFEFELFDFGTEEGEKENEKKKEKEGKSKKIILDSKSKFIFGNNIYKLNFSYQKNLITSYFEIESPPPEKVI